MKLRLTLALCAALLLSFPLSSTTVAQLSLDDLVASSDRIVIGRATSSQVRWVERVLVTDVTIEVGEWIAGSGPSSIVVTLPGGADFDREFPVAMNYPGAPSIGDGEETFLFLTSDPTFGNVVAGFSQGKFSIVDQGGEKAVSRDLTGTVLSTGTGLARGGPSVAISLEEFTANVRGSVAAAAARRATK